MLDVAGAEVSLQRPRIAVLVGESFAIDTDHWRHFWMMLGAMWGMFAAALRYREVAQPLLTAPVPAS